MDLHLPCSIHGCFRGGDPADHSQLAYNRARLISQTSRSAWGLCSQLKDTTGKPLVGWFWVGLVSQPRECQQHRTHERCWCSAVLGGKDHGLHENITPSASSERQLQLRVEKMMHEEGFSSRTEKILRRSRRRFARVGWSLTVQVFLEQFLKLKLKES